MHPGEIVPSTRELAREQGISTGEEVKLIMRFDN
jgi:hypothetical protein